MSYIILSSGPAFSPRDCLPSRESFRPGDAEGDSEPLLAEVIGIGDLGKLRAGAFVGAKGVRVKAAEDVAVEFRGLLPSGFVAFFAGTRDLLELPGIFFVFVFHGYYYRLVQFGRDCSDGGELARMSHRMFDSSTSCCC